MVEVIYKLAGVFGLLPFNALPLSRITRVYAHLRTPDLRQPKELIVLYRRSDFLMMSIRDSNSW